MDFIAIDFETANTKKAACALGLVCVENNEIVSEYYTLINPKQPFSKICTDVHGLTAKDVKDAPDFKTIWNDIEKYIKRYPIVAHNASFEEEVLSYACSRARVYPNPIVYYCTMELFKHNYDDCKKFNLPAVCEYFKIPLTEHHNALDDARAAAQILLFMYANKDFELFPYLQMSFDLDHEEEEEEDSDSNGVPFPVTDESYKKTTAIIDETDDIIFDGNTFVLTGEVDGYDRGDLVYMITERGGTVGSGVTKKTNYVITGMQDLSVVKDSANAKSMKIIKAEKLRDEGHEIKIICAEKFLEIIGRK